MFSIFHFIFFLSIFFFFAFSILLRFSFHSDRLPFTIRPFPNASDKHNNSTYNWLLLVVRLYRTHFSDFELKMYAFKFGWAVWCCLPFANFLLSIFGYNYSSFLCRFLAFVGPMRILDSLVSFVPQVV